MNSATQLKLEQILKELFLNKKSGIWDKTKELNLLKMLAEDYNGGIILSNETSNLITYGEKKLKRYEDYTYFHSINVAILAMLCGRAMGLHQQDINELGISGFLHDIGKIKIPIEIISKTDKLSDDEFALIKEHSLLGYSYVKNKMPNVSQQILNGILQHHEREDGSGYPNGIVGAEIGLFGKILAVCDTYDALTSERCYHKAVSPQEAIELLYGVQNLDKEVIKAFVHRNYAYPTGIRVKLSDGQVGEIIGQNRLNVCRPIIKVRGNTIDLATDKRALSVVITDVLAIN